ncbi:hypothetical protein F5888DRAFT_1809797 [Russula emetica]|nr:hypothetical protein F5888DRAFT_1809797 [Russula emetica]
MSFASLPSIPSLYETALVYSSELEATKSVSVDSKASPKVESVSKYITVPVCGSKSTSPFVTAEVCPTEASTEYEDAECRCKPEKVVVSEGIQAAVPEPIEQVVLQPVERDITEPVEEVVPTPAEEDVHAVPLPPARKEISIPIPEPVVAVEPIAGPPIIEIPREFLLYPPPSPTIRSPVKTTLSVSTTRIARSIPLPETFPHSFAGSATDDVATVVCRRVDSKHPTLTLSSRPANPRAPPSPFIRESLWAPETDDTYESSMHQFWWLPLRYNPYLFLNLKTSHLIRLSCGLPPPHTLLKSRAD